MSLALTGLLVAVASASAALGQEKFLPSSRGQGIAARVVLHARDLPAASGWFDLRLGIVDRHLDPCGRRVDDLVLTGYALDSFARGVTGAVKGVLISNADVFASREMLDRYVARTLAGRRALSCLRARTERRAVNGTRYVSFRAIRLPRLAPKQRAFRITLRPPHSEELWEEDAIFLARGKTLAVVSIASPVAAHDRAARLGYFRRVAERIPA